MAELTPDEGRDLLRLARASLQQRLLGDLALDDELARVRLTPTLSEPRGAFVTLKRRTDTGGETLRGCIGSLTPDAPLHRCVTRLVLKSAFEDPRFEPCEAAELPSLRIEISVLTPMRHVADVSEIEIGRHGVQIRARGESAIFLPQVAVEQRWDVEQLLRQLALKAGLPAEAWREAQLGVFEAQIFREPASGA